MNDEQTAQAQATELRASAASYREEAARLEQAADELDPQETTDAADDDVVDEEPAESMYPHLEGGGAETEEKSADDA